MHHIAFNLLHSHQDTGFGVLILQDHDAIESLTSLLDHQSLSIRNATHAALTQITGLGFPADPARWRSWYSLERKWLKERAPVLLNQLAGDDPVFVARAIREITTHLLQRPLFAEEIEGVLQRREPYLRALACTALGRIGGPTQLPALEICAYDTDQRVVSAARQAIERLTGPQTEPESGRARRTPQRRNPTSQRSRQ